jgi:predicted amidohydrolase
MTAAASISQQDAISAAMAVGRDVAEGRLAPGDLAAAAVAELRALVDTDAPADTELAALQAAVARRALAAGLLPAAELTEWLAVARSRAGEASTPATT